MRPVWAGAGASGFGTGGVICFSSGAGGVVGAGVGRVLARNGRRVVA